MWRKLEPTTFIKPRLWARCSYVVLPLCQGFPESGNVVFLFSAIWSLLLKNSSNPDWCYANVMYSLTFLRIMELSYTIVSNMEEVWYFLPKPVKFPPLIFSFQFSLFNFHFSKLFCQSFLLLRFWLLGRTCYFNVMKQSFINSFKDFTQ